MFPDGRIGYAVGDIHGRADLLADMCARLEQEVMPELSEPPLVIFLGDYIDRGPDSRAVIDLLLEGRPRGFEKRYLMGNHEQQIVRFLTDPVGGRAWLTHGGLATLASYGVARPMTGAGVVEAGAALRDALPDAHRVFFERLSPYCVIGSYLFVHAGIHPDRLLAEQTERDLLWIRDRFLNSTKAFSHVVVHGHTPAAAYVDHRRIGLDTGAYMTGVLTAVRLEGDAQEFIQVAR